MDPDYVFDLFKVPRAMRSDAMNVVTSPHMPSGKAFVVGADPATPEAGMVVMVDEANEVFADIARKGRKNAINFDLPRQQFPSLERFIEQYSKFVPHDTNNPKEKYTMDMSGLARMRADLEGMLTKFTEMVAVVERFGGEPGDGAVIKFEHTFDAPGRDGETKTYDYVAVRKFGKWYVSGRPFAGRAVKWSELLEFIGDGRAWIAEVWRYVPVPGATAEAVDTDMVAAFRNVLASSGGKDTTTVAEELLSLVDKSK